MTYSYKCKNCDHTFDLNLLIAERDRPLGDACPSCDQLTVVRAFSAPPALSYEGGKTVLQRAGSGWNDLLGKIKKGSGRRTNIETR